MNFQPPDSDDPTAGMESEDYFCFKRDHFGEYLPDAERAAHQAWIEDVREACYAEGRQDQREDDLRLLAWAYRKLMPYSFSKQEDALAMDEIKLMLMGAQ